jgi:hypothetical protein
MATAFQFRMPSLRSFALAVILCSLGACSDEAIGCESELVARERSPDGAHDAVIYDRDCGATDRPRRHVSVVPTGVAPEGMGNVLRTDSQQPVSAAWTGPRALLVTYGADQHPDKRSDAAGVDVTFEVASSP